MVFLWFSNGFPLTETTNSTEESKRPPAPRRAAAAAAASAPPPCCERPPPPAPPSLRARWHPRGWEKNGWNVSRWKAGKGMERSGLMHFRKSEAIIGGGIEKTGGGFCEMEDVFGKTRRLWIFRPHLATLVFLQFWKYHSLKLSQMSDVKRTQKPHKQMKRCSNCDTHIQYFCVHLPRVHTHTHNI